jgi:hypothetical protein
LIKNATQISTDNYLHTLTGKLDDNFLEINFDIQIDDQDGSFLDSSATELIDDLDNVDALSGSSGSLDADSAPNNLPQHDEAWTRNLEIGAPARNSESQMHKIMQWNRWNFDRTTVKFLFVILAAVLLALIVMIYFLIIIFN